MGRRFCHESGKRYPILSGGAGLLFHISRINQTAHCGNTIGWNAYPAGVLPNGVLVGREVNAVDLVFGDVAVEPLNLRSHFLQRLQGTQGQVPDLRF